LSWLRKFSCFYRDLDPDPDWDFYLDPDPDWNVSGSATLLLSWTVKGCVTKPSFPNKSPVGPFSYSFNCIHLKTVGNFKPSGSRINKDFLAVLRILTFLFRHGSGSSYSFTYKFNILPMSNFPFGVHFNNYQLKF
jgi:hypothetical protein